MVSAVVEHQGTGEAVAFRQGRLYAPARELPNDCADKTTARHRDRAFGTGYTGPAVFTRTSCGVLACLLFFAISLPVFADCIRVGEECKVGLLQRAKEYNYQLAVCQGDEWHICKHSHTRTYRLTVRSDQVDFFWAVPASERHEFIYASTLHTDGQHLSVWRRATYENSKLFHVFPPFRDIYKKFPKRYPDDQKSPRQRFREYHADSKSKDLPKGPVSELLSQWHDTEIWGRQESYGLVQAALVHRESQPLIAAERLMRLAEKRPKTSWAKFTSEVADGEELRIILAYSGSKRRTWPFNFKVSFDTVQVVDENEQ